MTLVIIHQVNGRPHVRIDPSRSHRSLSTLRHQGHLDPSWADTIAQTTSSHPSAPQPLRISAKRGRMMRIWSAMEVELLTVYNCQAYQQRTLIATPASLYLLIIRMILLSGVILYQMMTSYRVSTSIISPNAPFLTMEARWLLWILRVTSSRT